MSGISCCIYLRDFRSTLRFQALSMPPEEDGAQAAPACASGGDSDPEEDDGGHSYGVEIDIDVQDDQCEYVPVYAPTPASIRAARSAAAEAVALRCGGVTTGGGGGRGDGRASGRTTGEIFSSRFTEEADRSPLADAGNTPPTKHRKKDGGVTGGGSTHKPKQLSSVASSAGGAAAAWALEGVASVRAGERRFSEEGGGGGRQRGTKKRDPPQTKKPSGRTSFRRALPQPGPCPSVVPRPATVSQSSDLPPNESPRCSSQILIRSCDSPWYCTYRKLLWFRRLLYSSGNMSAWVSGNMPKCGQGGAHEAAEVSRWVSNQRVMFKKYKDGRFWCAGRNHTHGSDPDDMVHGDLTVEAQSSPPLTERLIEAKIKLLGSLPFIFNPCALPPLSVNQSVGIDDSGNEEWGDCEYIDSLLSELLLVSTPKIDRSN